MKSSISVFKNAANAQTPKEPFQLPTQKGRKRLVALLESYGSRMTYRELNEIYKKHYVAPLDDYEIRHLFGLKRSEKFDKFELFRERLLGYVDVCWADDDILFVLLEDDAQDFSDIEPVNANGVQQENVDETPEHEALHCSSSVDQRSASDFSAPVLVSMQSSISPATSAADPTASGSNLPACSVSPGITASGDTYGTSILQPMTKDSVSSDVESKVDIPNVIFSLLPKDGSGLHANDVFERLVRMKLFRDLNAARDAVQMAVLKNPSSFSFQSEAEAGLFLRAGGTRPATEAAQNQAREPEFDSAAVDEAAEGLMKDQVSQILESGRGALSKTKNTGIQERSAEIYGSFGRVENHILHDYAGLLDNNFIKINLENLTVIETSGGFCRILVDFSLDGTNDESDKREKFQNALIAYFALSDIEDDLRKIYLPKVGEHCVTFDESTAKYYRAEVLRYATDFCDVRLIDFWQERRVAMDCLQWLPPNLAEVPAFGLELFTPLFAINRGKEMDFWRLFSYLYSKSMVCDANVSAKICRKKPSDPLEILELRVELVDEQFSVFAAFMENRLIQFV